MSQFKRYIVELKKKIDREDPCSGAVIIQTFHSSQEREEFVKTMIPQGFDVLDRKDIVLKANSE